MREVDICAPSEEGGDGEKTKNATLPCRIHVKLVGLEWFVYNRSPAYDTVLDGLKGGDSKSTSSDALEEKDSSTLRARSGQQDDGSRGPIAAAAKEIANAASVLVPTKSAADSAAGEEELGQIRDISDLPFILQLCPIEVECQKPALVAGNANTKAIMIVKATSATAIVNASKTETCDPYRQVFKVSFNHPVVEMRENDEFKEDQLTRVTGQRQDDSVAERKGHYFFHRRRKIIHSLRNMVPYWRSSVESFSMRPKITKGRTASQMPGASHWQGLSRYLDDRYQGDKARWSAVEYAAETTILDSPSAVFTIYWDVAAKVSDAARRRSISSFSASINGSEPPAWGMSLSVKGGTMNYGPWADRQRADLQRVFFPTLSKDVVPAVPLPAGSWRLPTQFKLFVELEDSVTLRIPIREESKNWRWRGKEPPIGHPQGKKRRNKPKKSKGDAQPVRPAGWLELKVPANTTVSYSMDMLARPTGYQNQLDIDIPSTELSSSVNHDVLWTTGRQRISCDLSNPLTWNTMRNWRFNVDSTDMKLYLLRDHIFLLIDLVDDWATGPMSEYLVFTPYTYHLNLGLRNVRLYLNVNDENIIDKATSVDENAFLILSSPLLEAETSIPLDKFRPDRNAIPFDIRTDSFDLTLNAPQSNTQSTFLASNELGHGEGLTVNGSYQYNSTTSPANTDTLVLDVHAQSPYAYLYGFIVRYVILLKDNYFGDHVHFRTLDEYQEQLQPKRGVAAEVAPKKKSNDLDVILSIRVDDPRIMLPTSLYAPSEYVQAELASLYVDLRFTNYYMDLELILSPLSLSMGAEAIANPGSPSSRSTAASDVQLFIDGIRVFGHRTFGLPPTEPTYLCNWDVAVGVVDGQCTAGFISSLAKGGAAFGFMFDDVENALVPYSSLVFFDITFVRVDVASVHLWLQADEGAFLMSTGHICITSNDWARSHYSKRAEISIPNIELSCVNAESAAKHASRRHHPVDTVAYLHTDLRVASIGRKFHFDEERKIQQDLVRREDQRTDRTPFFLLQRVSDEFVPEPVEPPAQCAPPPPFPVDDGPSPRGSASRLRKKSSFLSFSSNSTGRGRSRSGRTGSYFTPDARSIRLPDRSSSSKIRRPSGSRLDHSTVAFSSQFFPPYFPLEGVQPDGREATFEEQPWRHHEHFWTSDMSLDDIDPDSLSQNHAQASAMIEFPTGITAFVKPEAVVYANSLLAAIQPSGPEAILDSLQTSTVGEIFSAKKKKHITGQMQELFIKLPKANLRFLNSGDSQEDERDQYDLRICEVLLISRTVKDVTNPNSRTSLRFTLTSAELSASERLSSIEKPQAAVMLNVDNVCVSLGAKDITYFDADVGSIVGSTASGKIEYLASLIHRTGSVASKLERMLSNTTSRQENRVKYLVHSLLKEGDYINDPPFLTRPPAVLRSADKHLRTVDSWKLMMRLRQIWSTMSPAQKGKLTAACKDQPPTPPSDAAEQAVAAFQKWRKWDLEDARSALLVRKIFGKSMNRSDPSQEYPLMGACRMGKLQLVLDPGPKQNNIGLHNISVRVDEQPTAPETFKEHMDGFTGPLTVLDMCCGEAIVHLNWELCELAEDVLRLYNRAPPRPPKEPSIAKVRSSGEAAPAAYHVVLEIVKGSIDSETINLTSNSRSEGLQTSVLACTGGKSMASGMIKCDSITSTLQSHSQQLGTLRLQKPSIFASHEIRNDSHAVKASATSQDLAFTVREDPVALLEALDLLIRDEAAQLKRLASRLPTKSEEPKRREKVADKMSAVRVNVAMFLEEYTITVPLLQSLTYKVTGSVARASCAVAGKDIIFDFDVKENAHEMQININNRPQSLSLVQVPPANGRITSQQKSGHVVTVLASMEVIELDASAIYSLLSTLNRPQISGAVDDIQQQIKIIQGHIAEMFETKQPVEPPKPAGSPLAYDIQLTLAGLQTLAKTSLRSKDETVGQVLFALDKVSLQASNQQEADAPALKYPDLHVNLRRIRFDILRGNHENMRSCGSLSASINVAARSRRDEDGKEDWSFYFENDDLDINLSPETVSTAVDVVGYMGSRLRDLDTSQELDYLRKLRQPKPKIVINDDQQTVEDTDIFESVLASITYQFELRQMRICWDVADETVDDDANKEDLVLSVKMIEFGTRTRKSARLSIQDLMVQTVPPGQDKSIRSLHSALLPQVTFNVAYVSTSSTRRMAFQAIGDSLDLRLTSAFIVPAANLIKSISLSMKNVQTASAQWASPVQEKKEETATQSAPTRSMFGNKRVESLLVDADFAGAVVYVSTKKWSGGIPESRYSQPALAGKYGQFSADDSGSGAVLRSPGLAWKALYRDDGQEDPSLSGEIRIDASSNILYPSVVPLVLDIVASVKEVVGDDKDKPTAAKPTPKMKPEKTGDEDNILTADPSTVLGRVKLNLGLRICRQEFSLSCQPIARVAATTCFENVYFTLTTVSSQEQGNFFAISGALTRPQASVQHVYSRDSTASFEVDAVTVSFINSKHVSGISGVSAILNVSPMKVSVNAKQVQDFLLFREIWYPEELRQKGPVGVPQTEAQGHLVQRYQQVAATAAFPWTATISIAALDVSVDLGQAIGKSVFRIADFWVSSKKTSDWEQNLCLGFKKIGADCTGRLSGFVALQDFRLRTSIQWPQRQEALNATPLVQASLAFNALQIKAAFDYQAFLVADVRSLEFLMYNVREKRDGSGDRLVAIFDGEAVQVFGTTTSAAQAVALYQALKKLVKERRANFESSIKEIEKFMRRKSMSRGVLHQQQQPRQPPKLPADDTLSKSPISLDTDVVVTLKALNLGIFPSTFSDHQVFKMEAQDAYARFAASIEHRQVHSMLRMTLGQLRIGLAGVRDAEAPKTMSEMTVEDVVKRSTGSRGGTILKVPRVEALMETWQKPTSNHIDYVFKSAFEGKVEVGWNYSRVSYIRGMFANHTKSLEQIWGRQLPMTAVKISGVPEAGDGEQQKITAEVNVPLSKYDYRALEPPVIETPQLRDMGEATPPLEWIGLHRDRLPNLTHQIVIVSLLELAGEVEDAYSRILGAT